MTGFLAELAKNAAGRWFNLLVLPGLLWVATFLIGLRLGHGHALDAHRLRVWAGQLTARGDQRLPSVISVLALVSLGSAAAGYTASALGGGLQRLWALPGERPPAVWLLAWRQRRWDRANDRLRGAIAQAANAQTTTATRGQPRHGRRLRLRPGRTRPIRPTRIGDRLSATAVRIRDHNGLRVDTAWPRLWAVLPDPLRTDLGLAQTSYAASARLTAWGLLYLPVATVWWPATVIGLTVILTGTAQARSATTVLADLVETACDLHTKDLAAALGLPADRAPLDLGKAVTERLGDGREPGQTGSAGESGR